MENNRKSKSYFQNWISVIGRILAIVFGTSIAFLFLADLLFSSTSNPYLEGLTYLLLPAFLVVSLLMIPLGALRERRRRRNRGDVQGFPRIDFNDPLHQKWAFTTISILTLFGLVSVFGSYRAYEFTDSNTFCGKVCHVVMEPEFTAYQNSPHARVACVDCHIGPGAKWYVRSKLSGLYQIYATLADSYPRPIDTPIENLRPAQETCEQCHWPEQFFGAVEQDHTYFLPDEKNTKWNTRMLLKVGGRKRPFGKGRGIHWHMNIANRIYYIATDEKRQDIPWVKKVSADGREVIYVDEESDYSVDNPPDGELRLLDCIDCHNRPSHIFKAPYQAVNEALASEQIDPTLPYIKREAVESLVGEYPSDVEAAKSIRDRLEKFYHKEYPQIWKEKRDTLDSSIEALTDLYRNNFFPRMKVSWEEYPDNIGHFIFPGCYRCHAGQHKDPEGEAITNDCSACHSIIAQGSGNEMETSVYGLEFKHPEDIDEEWKESLCDDCHDGGNVE